MALALADSLLPATAGADPRAAQFDPDDQGRRIVAWWRESAYTPDDDRPFDVGGTTLAAIRALETGRPAVDAGRATASRAAASASRSCWGRSAWVTRDSTGGDLDLDVARLRTLGVDVLLLLVEDDELAWCHVPELPAVIRAAGIELVRFAIRDPRVPTDDAAFRTVVEDLVARLRAGGSVAIACRGGIDRSGMAAGGVLVSAGLDLGDATDRIHAGRRGSLSGPLAGLFGGADISYFVRFLVAGVLYVAPSRPSRRVQGDS